MNASHLTHTRTHAHNWCWLWSHTSSRKYLQCTHSNQIEIKSICSLICIHIHGQIEWIRWSNWWPRLCKTNVYAEAVIRNSLIFNFLFVCLFAHSVPFHSQPTVDECAQTKRLTIENILDIKVKIKRTTCEQQQQYCAVCVCALAETNVQLTKSSRRKREPQH